MDKILEAFIKRNYKIFVTATGAGAGIQSILWGMPGSSSYLIGCQFPYDKNEFDRFIGYRLEKHYNSPDAAVELALESFIRANEAIETDLTRGYPIGMGITAAVPSNRERKSSNSFYISICSNDGMWSMFGTLELGGVGRDARERDGKIIDTVTMLALAKAFSIDTNDINVHDDKYENSVGGNVRYGIDHGKFKLDLKEMYSDHQKEVFFRHPHFTSFQTKDDGGMINSQNTIFMPGTFNPIHDGHRDSTYKVEKLTGKRVVYMTTCDPPHKPPMTVPQMLAKVAMMRLERFGHYEPRSLIFTHGDPLFIQKATKWPNASFVIGYDTAARMLDAKWGEEIIPMLHKFRNLGTKFYVLGRIEDGRLFTIKDLIIPYMFRELFIEVPNSGTEHSSSAIRAARENNANKT